VRLSILEVDEIAHLVSEWNHQQSTRPGRLSLPFLKEKDFDESIYEKVASDIDIPVDKLRIWHAQLNEHAPEAGEVSESLEL